MLFQLKKANLLHRSTKTATFYAVFRLHFYNKNTRTGYIKWLISTHQADFLMSQLKQQTNFGWSGSDMFSIAVYRVGKAVCPHHIKIA